MIKKINEKILKASVAVKQSTTELLKDESGNGLIVGLLVGGVIILAIVVAAPTITTFITGITTYVTTFFDTEIKGILN